MVGEENFKLKKAHKQGQSLCWEPRNSKWLSLAGSWVGVVHNMIRKVSWGQIMKETEFQTKAFKLLWRQWSLRVDAFWVDHWNYWTGGMIRLDCGHWTCIPHFYQIKYMCTWFFGWRQEILWYFPRVIFSLYTSERETEDPMSISKKWAVPGQWALTSARQNRSALSRVCAAHIQLIAMGKADIPSANNQTHKITQECTVCWFELHRRLPQPERKDLPIYVPW